jgi:hypothetical protein
MCRGFCKETQKAPPNYAAIVSGVLYLFGGQSMRFDKNENRWSSSFPRLGLEINLGGTADGVLPVNEEMASYVERNFDAILEDAVIFVTKQVNENFAISGSPEAQWVDFGLSNYGEHNEFELFFNDKDTYTLWGVRFNYNLLIGTKAEKPVGFSRRAW